MAKCDIDFCNRGYRTWGGTCTNPCGEECAHNSDYVPLARPVVLPIARNPVVMPPRRGTNDQVCTLYDVYCSLVHGR